MVGCMAANELLFSGRSRNFQANFLEKCIIFRGLPEISSLFPRNNVKKSIATYTNVLQPRGVPVASVLGDPGVTAPNGLDFGVIVVC